MRHIIYFTVLLLVAAPSPKGPFLSESQLSQQLAHLNDLKKLSADFSQVRNVKEWGTAIKTSGHFEVINKPEKRIVWKITAPSYTAIKMENHQLSIKTSTDSTAWQSMDNPKVVAQMQNIFAWLSMDSKIIANDFNVRKMAPQTLQLIPKSKESIFQKINVHLNSEGQVTKLKLVEKSQDSIDIQFSNTNIVK